jgi:23S rRNA (cytosine1962-C5)-methyltransferase
MKKEIKIFCSEVWSSLEGQDYELLDTGNGEKMEKFGKYIFVRPFEDALWGRSLSEESWSKIDGKFASTKEGVKPGWKLGKGVEKKWVMSYKGIKFFVSPTPFRHLGFFPEQASHWDFIEEEIKTSLNSFSQSLGPSFHSATPSKKNISSDDGKKIKFLNLFGYTGVASLFALRAGAEVTHVDASKKVLDWAKENQNLNQDLADKPMRIIEDDVLKFLEREERRGNKYDCVIMDPPKHGRGPKGEVWEIEEMLPVLLARVNKILSDKPLFVILTSYSTNSSALSLGYALKDGIKKNGQIEAGELCILQKSNGNPVSFANTAFFRFD